VGIFLIEESIEHQWSAIVEFRSGEGEALLEEIAQRIDECDLPGCDYGYENIHGAGFPGAGTRCLVVRNRRFQLWGIILFARDYGSHLEVACLTAYLEGSVPDSFYGKQELDTWSRIVCSCCMTATKALEEGAPNVHRSGKWFLEHW
jgi:hypothetical protein